MAFGDADRSVFVNTNEFGVSVTVGATTSSGSLHTHYASEEAPGGGFAKTNRFVLRVLRGAFTRPSVGGSVTVGGTAYVYDGLAARSPTSVDASSGFEFWLLKGSGNS